jgi:hypothetical protein
LAQAAAQSSDFWEKPAARLVDAKMGGLARRLRKWPEILAGENWPERLLEEIGDSYLLAEAVSDCRRLPAPLRCDALNTAGWNIPKEEILTQTEPVRDRWLICGIFSGEDENLRYRRTYLLGEESGFFALLLDFAWGKEEFQEKWRTGGVLSAECYYYPSAFPMRALPRACAESTPAFSLSGEYLDFEAFFDAYARAVSANPWLFQFPALIDKVVPYVVDERCFLADRSAQALPLGGLSQRLWKLIALSGGHSLRLFGEWDGQYFMPLSVFDGDRLVDLN